MSDHTLEYMQDTHCRDCRQAAEDGRYLLGNRCIVCVAAKAEQDKAELLAVCKAIMTAFEQDKWTDAVALHMHEVRTAVANAKVTQPRAAPDLLAACEVIASMERYTFIDTPPIKVVEKLQQQIAEMKTIAQIALANVAKAKPAKKRGER